ncbi:hypothetical protein [Pseudomonas sp. ICMP 561]|uniref:hypothetical protein n=1 Tax=Pseudomonas sp. ICMP 561 TaxID=1718918 RepID=UPI000C072FDF|nr:hypothetical protein [Pseudomonas sp. ICMP 561]PHN28920.1 hypothetical protein AO242_25895 [Pseudomonas sp. ICMP 561]
MGASTEEVSRLALKAVLATAIKQGLELEALCEASIDWMLNDAAYGAEDVAWAVSEIEVTADSIESA